MLVLLVCMVIALVRWRRHPRVSGLVLLSLAWLFLTSLVSSVIYAWVPDWLLRTGAAPTNVYVVLGFVSNFSLAIEFAIFVVAILIQRRPATGSK